MEKIKEWVGKFHGVDKVPITYYLCDKLVPMNGDLENPDYFESMGNMMAKRAPIIEGDPQGLMKSWRMAGPSSRSSPLIASLFITYFMVFWAALRCKPMPLQRGASSVDERCGNSFGTISWG